MLAKCFGLVCLSVACVSATRLLNVDLSERIRHFFIESSYGYDSPEKSGPVTHFLTLCGDKQLSAPFPQFLCPLAYLMSKQFDTGTKKIYPSTNMAVSEVNNLKNHPCEHENRSCIVVFLPNDHILLGCADLEAGNLSSSLAAADDFKYDFVVYHNISTGSTCEYNTDGSPLCSMDSIFVQGYLLAEQHSCCCPSGYCATVMIDQPVTGTPFVQMVVDLQDIGLARKRRKRSELDMNRPKPRVISAKHMFPADVADPSSPSRSLPVIAISFPFILVIFLTSCIIFLCGSRDRQPELDGLELAKHDISMKDLA